MLLRAMRRFIATTKSNRFWGSSFPNSAKTGASSGYQSTQGSPCIDGQRLCSHSKRCRYHADPPNHEKSFFQRILLRDCTHRAARTAAGLKSVLAPAGRISTTCSSTICRKAARIGVARTGTCPDSLSPPLLHADSGMRSVLDHEFIVIHLASLRLHVDDIPFAVDEPVRRKSPRIGGNCNCFLVWVCVLRLTSALQ
jgi:hypothetical protein